MDDSARWSELDLAVVDVEGNGARPPDLVELAVVPLRGGVIGEPMSWLVRPAEKISWQARRVHGITDTDVADQPAFADVADDVRQALGNGLPVGHSVKVDLGVMTRKLPDWSPAEAFDTLRMARATWDLPSHKLGDLVAHHDLAQNMPDGLRPHRAAYDALVTARLLVELAERSGAEPWTVAELRRRGGLDLRPAPEPEPQLGLFT